MGVTRRVVMKARQPQALLQIPRALVLGALDRNDPELALRVLRVCVRMPEFANKHAATYFGLTELRKEVAA